MAQRLFGGNHKAREAGKPADEIVRQLRQRMAILLVKDNDNMFNPRTPLYPQAVIEWIEWSQ